jgi:hypothetical protein
MCLGRDGKGRCLQLVEDLTKAPDVPEVLGDGLAGSRS